MVTDLGREAAIRRLDREDQEDLITGVDDSPPVSSNSDPKVTVYSMINGEPKVILRLDRARVLDKYLADGRPAFWAEGMPGEPPEYTQGNVRCMLHPDFDEADGASGFARSFIDGIGLQGLTCNGNSLDKKNVDNFKTVFDRDEHMRMKHKRSWRTIEAALERDARKLEHDEQKRATDAIIALASQNASLAVEAVEKAPVAAESMVCDICDWSGTNLAVHKKLKTDDAHKAARGE